MPRVDPHQVVYHGRVVVVVVEVEVVEEVVVVVAAERRSLSIELPTGE